MAESKTVLDNCLTLGDISHEEFVAQASNRLYAFRSWAKIQIPTERCILPLQYRLSKPGPGPNIKFLPEVESVRKAVVELKQQNINKIIAVGHAGIEVDKRIAKEVDGVDIVVGGHTNTFLYTGIIKSTVNPTRKVQHCCKKIWEASCWERATCTDFAAKSRTTSRYFRQITTFCKVAIESRFHVVVCGDSTEMYRKVWRMCKVVAVVCFRFYQTFFSDVPVT